MLHTGSERKSARPPIQLPLASNSSYLKGLDGTFYATADVSGSSAVDAKAVDLRFGKVTEAVEESRGAGEGGDEESVGGG